MTERRGYESLFHFQANEEHLKVLPARNEFGSIVLLSPVSSQTFFNIISFESWSSFFFLSLESQELKIEIRHNEIQGGAFESW